MRFNNRGLDAEICQHDSHLRGRDDSPSVLSPQPISSSFVPLSPLLLSVTTVHSDHPGAISLNTCTLSAQSQNSARSSYPNPHRALIPILPLLSQAIFFFFFFFFWSQFLCVLGSDAPCSTSVVIYMLDCVSMYM